MIAIRDSRIVRIAVTASLLAFPVGAGADEQRGDSSIPRRQWPQSMAAGAVSIDQSTVTETRLGATRPWSRVSVPDPVAGHATRAALDRGWTLLGQSACARILTDFTDREGRPLAEHLNALGIDAQTYLTMVVFIDDTRNPLCGSGVLALTAPGSRVVRLCSEVVKQTWQQDSAHTVAALIHEMLHTLGLGENPPSSKEITRRVLDRCRED